MRVRNNDFNREIAERLKWLRKSNNLSQAAVANLLGVKPAAYSKIENCNSVLSVEGCVILAEHYGVTCDFILHGNYEINALFFTEHNLKRAQDMLVDLSALLSNVSAEMVMTYVSPSEVMRY